MGKFILMSESHVPLALTIPAGVTCVFVPKHSTEMDPADHLRANISSPARDGAPVIDVTGKLTAMSFWKPFFTHLAIS